MKRLRFRRAWELQAAFLLLSLVNFCRPSFRFRSSALLAQNTANLGSSSSRLRNQPSALNFNDYRNNSHTFLGLGRTNGEVRPSPSSSIFRIGNPPAAALLLKVSDVLAISMGERGDNLRIKNSPTLVRNPSFWATWISAAHSACTFSHHRVELRSHDLWANPAPHSFYFNPPFYLFWLGLKNRFTFFFELLTWG